MTNSSFKVRNTLVVNNTIQVNTGGLYFSNTLTLNSTVYVGSSNNSSYLGGISAATYVTSNGQYTFSNRITHSANLTLNSTISLSANGTIGTANQVLASNGTSPSGKLLLLLH